MNRSIRRYVLNSTVLSQSGAAKLGNLTCNRLSPWCIADDNVGLLILGLLELQALSWCIERYICHRICLKTAPVRFVEALIHTST